MFEIDEKLLQAILDYLSKRPFIEVANLINGLAKSPRVEEKDKKPSPK